MKRVFFLDQGEFIGGAERFLFDFFQTLSESEIRRIRPTVIGTPNAVYRASIPSEIEYETLTFPSFRGNVGAKIRAVGKALVAAKKLKKITKETQAPYFFSNTPRTAIVCFLARKFFRLSGKWVCFFHDFTLRPAALVRAIASEADVLAVNSLATRNFLRDQTPQKHWHKIKIIENGVDMAQVAKDFPENPSPEGASKVLMLGRIDPRKGQFHALEAADLLLERNPDIRFSVVGSPVDHDPETQDYAQKCHDFAHHRNLTNVTFKPEVTNPFAEMAAHDVVLILPTEPETFGRIVIECLAMRRFPVSFDQTGPREILHEFYLFLGRHGGVELEENPFLIEAGNAMSVAEKIGSLGDHFGPLEKQICDLGPEFVAQKFSLQETKKRLLEQF